MTTLAKLLSALVVALVSGMPAAAEDGDILDRTQIKTPDHLAVTVEQVTYESDGLRIVGFLAYPDDAPDQQDKPLPCIIFNRGGNRDFGTLSPRAAVAWGSIVAKWGYVFFASNYRGSPGSEGNDEFGGGDVSDVINGIKVLDNIPFADAKRIGMWGHSRGGMLTYLALKQTDRIAAAAVGAGIADVGRMLELRPEMEAGVLAECVADWATEKESAIAARSAVEWADELPTTTAILLLHGTADWRVDPKDSLDMAALLMKARVPYRLIMYEGADHGLSEFQKESDEEVRKWFDRYVRDKEPLPNLEPHGR